MENPDADFRRRAASTRQLAIETTDTPMVALLLRLAEAYEEMARRRQRPAATRAGATPWAGQAGSQARF